jgi:hypothetical protein
MTPSLSVPTDNIYKFACLFGLALIVTAVFSFVTTYNSTLDRKVRYSEAIIPLELKSPRAKLEEDMLEMNKKLLKVTQDNEKAANYAFGLVLGLGLILSASGAHNWYKKVQQRDDELAQLQMRKLEAEIEKLNIENQSGKHADETQPLARSYGRPIHRARPPRNVGLSGAPQG